MLYKTLFKPLFDIFFTSILLILLSPIILVISIALFFYLKSSPFFFQSRPGFKGRIFKIIKFKTMLDSVDHAGKLLPDSERITGFGTFLRANSLDELPQLINVMKGDLSIIGPRPLIPEYLKLYSAEQARRHDVKPGITGWAQVNGRNAISWKEKFILDVWYVDNISLKLDLKILCLTLLRVARKNNINKEGHATTDAFNGSN